VPFYGQPCPSCGGKELVRRQGGFACAFCGARVVPRLEPGTLCADAEGGFCSHPAESLCRACSRPLCDRHNDPRRLYWHAKLDWSVLCPGWKTADRTQWARLNAALPRFPAPDIEPPFEWHRFEKESRQAVGGLEHEMLEAVRPLARRWSGDATEMGCVFDGVCAECVREAEQAVSEVVAAYVVRYRQVALRDRLAALRKECEQGLRYVEAVLGRAPAASIPDEDALPPLDTLDGASPRLDWDRWGIRLRKRLEAIDRFTSRVASCGSENEGDERRQPGDRPAPEGRHPGGPR
jgi:hypothetical protein